MKVKSFEIPATFRKARTILLKLGDEAMPVAGATALHFYGDNMTKTAVDISRLGLDGIRKTKGVFRVGATTSISELVRFKSKGWVLNEVGLHLSTQSIRNVSTIGGNIARIFPWADLPVALLALNASLVIRGEEERIIPADEYFASQPARLYKTGDLLVAVEVPPVMPGRGFGYHKEHRAQAAFSMMTAAAWVALEQGAIADVRLAAGAGIPFPRRLPEVEKALIGQPATGLDPTALVAEGTKSVTWKGKEGMSDEYAGILARTVLGDVITQALARAEGAKS